MASGEKFKSKKKLFYAAIDFGTTYSGYAAGSRDELKKIGTKEVEILTSSWVNELGNCITEKTPTSILFTKDKKFHSFGYEAEKMYADLADDDEHEGWRFFKHFKMMLHGTRVRKHTRILDDQGQRMLAIDVFAGAIRYLKDRLFETLKLRVPLLEESDIEWVITVPAIWTYNAKQFMKAAAIEAGLPAEYTHLAHEPEAAAIYCKFVEARMESDAIGCKMLTPLEPGSQFMVLDLGGGTIDITTFEIHSDNSLMEVCPRGGGPWGGNLVNEGLYALFENTFGPEFMEDFETENKHDHLTIIESLELKKRVVGLGTLNNKVKMQLLCAFSEFYKQTHKTELQSVLRDKEKSPCVIKGKIVFNESDFENAFRESKDNLITEVKTLFKKYSLKKVNTLVMVGGFSDSPIMQKAIKDAFPDKTFIVPKDASSVILKGAVYYGFRRSLIRSRKLPYTFGISTSQQFNPRIHRADCRNALSNVDNIFCPFVHKGAEVTEKGLVVEKTFGTKVGNSVEIYQTAKDDVKGLLYTIESHFECIGKIYIKRSDSSEFADVKMTFGIFDIEVAVREHGSEIWKKENFEAL